MAKKTINEESLALKLFVKRIMDTTSSMLWSRMVLVRQQSNHDGVLETTWSMIINPETRGAMDQIYDKHEGGKS